MIQQMFNTVWTLLVGKVMLNDLLHTLDDELELVDPAVRPILVSLNRAGFKTSGSCEGHLSITGKVTDAYIGFEEEPSPEDKKRIREIIAKHTNVPIRLFRYKTVWFKGSLRDRPTASPMEACDLLRDIERGGGGPGRSVEKILSMYDVKDLEEMCRLFEAELERMRKSG